MAVSYLHSTSAQSNISLSNVVLRCGPIASHVFVNEYLHDTKKPNITLPRDEIKARKKMLLWFDLCLKLIGTDSYDIEVRATYTPNLIIYLEKYFLGHINIKVKG